MQTSKCNEFHFETVEDILKLRWLTTTVYKLAISEKEVPNTTTTSLVNSIQQCFLPFWNIDFQCMYEFSDKQSQFKSTISLLSIQLVIKNTWMSTVLQDTTISGCQLSREDYYHKSQPTFRDYKYLQVCNMGISQNHKYY